MPIDGLSHSPASFDSAETPCIPSMKLGEKLTARLSLDRLTLLIDSHAADQGSVKEYLVSLKYDPEVSGADGIVPAGTKAKHGATVGLIVKVPTSTKPLIWSAQNAALLQLKRRASGAFYFRLELFPLALTPGGFAHVRDKLLGYTLMLKDEQILASRVTRLDIALDLHGVRLRDFSWERGATKISHPWAKAGSLETIYHGSARHGSSCIYDKGAEQKLGSGLAWTRVEVRPQLNSPLATLPTLANLLAKVRVCDVRTAMMAIGAAEPFRETALAYAHLHGHSRLPFLYPDTKGPGAALSPRAVVRQALEKAVPAWWQPEAFWALWPQALGYALPDLFADGVPAGQ